MYLALKGLHLITMTLSILMYLARGLLMMQNSPRLDDALFRHAPNIIDGLLIVSAVALALLLGWYPFINEWVTIKLIATLVYLGFSHAGYHGRKNLVYGLGLLPLLVILVTVAY